MYIAGIDVGTTGCKCTVYDSAGNFQKEAYQEYQAEITKESHTINPNLVWESVKKVLSQIASEIKEIEAICVTTFGEASVLLDEQDTPLTDSILYTDPRGEEECSQLVQSLGNDYIAKNTGLTPGKMYSVSKWIWLKKHQPHVFEACTHICLFEDFIVYKLCGVFQIDYSLATRTMAFDINKLDWDENILRAAGVNKQKLSKPAAMGAKAANMKPDLVRRLGFQKSPVIVSGCHDQLAAAIGTGVLKKGMAVDGTGTVECITSIFEPNTHVDYNALSKGGYAVVPFIDHTYATYAFSFTGGALLKWYRNQLANLEAEIAQQKGMNAYACFDEQIDISSPSGLLLLPYFAGAGTPYMDIHAQGVLVGLTLDTTRAQIYQALMEGVTYEMKLNLEKLNRAGIHIEKIYATGGGASSEQWLQMKADILQKEIVSLGAAQSGTLGCIMLAAVACGIFSSLEQAAGTFVHYKKIYKPRSKMKDSYEKYYQQYLTIYPRMKTLWKEETSR